MPLPITRYAGGKGAVIETYPHLFPSAASIAARGGVFREVFAGAAAVSLHRYAGRCSIALSDWNGWMVRLHRVVRDNPHALAAVLTRMSTRYDKETYLQVRAMLNAGTLGPVDEAVAVLVILRWGYNGLFRVNRMGKINTPFGKPSKAGTIPRLFDPANLFAVSAALQGVPLERLDFERSAARAMRRDVVYLDPPYEPISPTASFTAYAPDWRVARAVDPAGPLHVDPGSDLARIVRTCLDLDARGVQWMLSNSDTPITRRAFARRHVHRIMVPRSISSATTKRAAVPEIFVTNYPV